MDNYIFNDNNEGLVKNCKISIIRTNKESPDLILKVFKENKSISKGLWVNNLKDLLKTRNMLFLILNQNKVHCSKNIRFYKLIKLINNLNTVDIIASKPSTYLEIKLN